VATCTQVDNLLQAYIDGALSQAERVIVEQHMLDCPACVALLHQQQRVSAIMFETLAADRLPRDLRQSVLENLPEIDRVPMDVANVNWRVKHSVSPRWARISRAIPVAVGVVLLIIAVLLRYEWPATLPGDNVVGMVMFSQGKAMRHVADSTVVEAARASGVIRPGDRFETGDGASMMLTLAGPTEIKVAANSVVHVHNDRWVSVSKGRIWLDVSADERFFRVMPPSGEITVLGTEFDVNVLSDRTRVTVAEGRVHVGNGRANTLLTQGQQVDIFSGAEFLEAQAVDTSLVMRWAHGISASAEAQMAYTEHIVPRTHAKILRAEQVFMLLRSGGSTSIKSIEVQWTPDGHEHGHADYLVYAFNSKNKLLFNDVIPGSVFDAQENSSYKVLVPEGAVEDFRVLYIRVEPDFSTGTIETSFKNTILAETR
jgi:hypothetical protein